MTKKEAKKAIEDYEYYVINRFHKLSDNSSITVKNISSGKNSLGVKMWYAEVTINKPLEGSVFKYENCCYPEFILKGKKDDKGK